MSPQRETHLSQYIFGLQAAPLLASGVYSLLWPAAAAGLPNSPLKGVSPGTIQAMRSVSGLHQIGLMLTSYSLTSLSLGTFYAIASYQNNIPMMIASVPGRLLAAIVFRRSGGGWASVAPFEGLMGIVTAIGVYWSV
ncbi:hypothetical protein N7510_011706 [Penicillium lagena]|uniref:uncharacterized protein n=1 Tax=Penicillium lagena TaxID=94218 RepID=UPI00253FCFBE|nr:uncharacterized protein N7510_011706 [Penicillium lagena]KAJ5602172.1 hypothetical protein N7510_011706 [Penicillium lagena]